MSSSGEYVCTLDEKSLKKAKEELKEDPKNRLGAVDTFRQWILQQPHIKCPTDTAFLLNFLRVRYFSQLEARKLLENYLTRRTKFSKWFRDLDTCDSKIQAVLSDGPFIVLPGRDDEGRQIYIIRPGHAKFKNGYTSDDMFRTFACLLDWLYQMSEMTCVNGTVTIVDFGSYSMKFHSSVTLEDRRDFMQTWQSNFPARLKQLHMYNAGAMAEIILTVVRFCMSEKIQQRMKIHGQVLESVYKDVPMRLLPKEYLPDDYTGPHAGTEKELIENMKNELKKPEVRDRIRYLSSAEFGIFEQKGGKGKADNEPQASFRKLNID